VPHASTIHQSQYYNGEIARGGDERLAVSARSHYNFQHAPAHPHYNMPNKLPVSHVQAQLSLSQIQPPIQAQIQSTQQQRTRFSDRRHKCPLEGCQSTFSRKFNMIQHFKSHAQRLKIPSEVIDQGVQDIKDAKAVKLTF
jgi:hypothetical protein